jgi:hypothetical protein
VIVFIKIDLLWNGFGEVIGLRVRFPTAGTNSPFRLNGRKLSADHPGSYRIDTVAIPSPEVKRPERETNHLPFSTALINNEWKYTSTPAIRVYGAMHTGTNFCFICNELTPRTASVGFEVLTVGKIHTVTFWFMTPCVS